MSSQGETLQFNRAGRRGEGTILVMTRDSPISGSVRFGSKFTGIRVFSVPVSCIKTTIWVINMENWFHDQDRVNPKGQTWETPRKHMTHHLGPCTSHFSLFWKEMCGNRGFGSNGSTYT